MELLFLKLIKVRIKDPVISIHARLMHKKEESKGFKNVTVHSVKYFIFVSD